jgi:hypothetical protein
MKSQRVWWFPASERATSTPPRGPDAAPELAQNPNVAMRLNQPRGLLRSLSLSVMAVERTMLIDEEPRGMGYGFIPRVGEVAEPLWWLCQLEISKFTVMASPE